MNPRSRSRSRSRSPTTRFRSRSRSPPTRLPPTRQKQNRRQNRRQNRSKRPQLGQRTFGHTGLNRLANTEINNITGDTQAMNHIVAKCAELDWLFASTPMVTFKDLSTQFQGESFPILYTYIYCTHLRRRLESNLSKKY